MGQTGYPNLESFEIVQTGTYTLSSTLTTSNPGAGNFIAESNNFNNITHGLGFKPVIFSYMNISGTDRNIPLPTVNFAIGAATQAYWYKFSINVDSTQVSFFFSTMVYGASSFSYSTPTTFKYFLTREKSS